MCLGVPGRITEIDDSGDLRMGTVDFGGVSREACLAYVPEAEVDDYVLIHVGFAISLLTPEEAEASLATIAEMVDIEDELGGSDGPS